LWNTTGGSQKDATQINISHLTSNGVDIDVFYRTLHRPTTINSSPFRAL
jgi:hypothetical protein